MLDLRYVQLPLPAAGRSVDDLTAYEQAELERSVGMRDRNGWLASRWLIKRILQERQIRHVRGHFDPSNFSVLSRDQQGRPTRPQVICNDSINDFHVSIAHTRRGVLVGVSRRADMALGVDLAQPRQVGVGSLDPWYTQPERLWIQRQQSVDAAAQIWTIKQAYYKAVNRGEAFSPRRIEVTLDASGHFQCRYNRLSHDVPAYIAVTRCDDHVAALVVILPENMPSEVPATYHSVFPQSELIRIERKV